MGRFPESSQLPEVRGGALGRRTGSEQRRCWSVSAASPVRAARAALGSGASSEVSRRAGASPGGNVGQGQFSRGMRGFGYSDTGQFMVSATVPVSRCGTGTCTESDMESDTETESDTDTESALVRAP